MKLYNSLTRQKQDFIANDNKVGMYVCGPTVYNYFHVGNARCFIVFDMLRRYLEYRGMQVTYVQNFTDVDDKLIRRSAEEGITVREVADKYIKEYYVDADGLGIHRATIQPRATESIDLIIDFIQKLIDKGHAYVKNGDVYFDFATFSDYGKLSGHRPDDLEAGSRVDVNSDKKNPFDFALWKARKENENIFWQSPWGEGRPGWHIECSAMSYKYLGSNFDIHAGGPDLIFPHHENEIAQTECATGEPMARFWCHIGFINVDNKKMSKSAGNFFMVRDAAKQYGYLPIRYLCLASHYRSPINFSAEILESAVSSVERLQNCEENILFRQKTAVGDMNDAECESIKLLEQKKSEFIAAMDDDFNTADAFSYLFEMTREINTRLGGEVSAEYLQKAYDLHFELASLLGFEYKPQSGDGDQWIEDLIAERTAAKKAKNYARADEIRQELKDKGILIQDTPQGVKWSRA